MSEPHRRWSRSRAIHLVAGFVATSLIAVGCSSDTTPTAAEAPSDAVEDATCREVLALPAEGQDLTIRSKSSPTPFGSEPKATVTNIGDRAVLVDGEGLLAEVDADGVVRTGLAFEPLGALDPVELRPGESFEVPMAIGLTPCELLAKAPGRTEPPSAGSHQVAPLIRYTAGGSRLLAHGPQSAVTVS